MNAVLERAALETRKLLAVARRNRQRNDAARQLIALDDHRLRDIGLSRQEIDGIAADWRSGCWRPRQGARRPTDGVPHDHA